LTDEKITDIKEYLNRSIKVTASSLIPQLSKYGIDLIDTIEALQQENEQLQAQVARVREALRKAREVLYNLRMDDYPGFSAICEALAEIDKVIGGREDD
jgi:chromosome segregation ATPase